MTFVDVLGPAVLGTFVILMMCAVFALATQPLSRRDAPYLEIDPEASFPDARFTQKVKGLASTASATSGPDAQSAAGHGGTGSELSSRLVVSVCVAALLTFLPASGTFAKPVQVLTLQVTSQGLLIAGVPVKDKRVTLPKGQRVRLVFQHADRNLDRHQFNLAATRTDITSQYIDPLLRRTASIDFTVGAQGEAFYRLSCMVPCAAMEFLIDYLIFVEPAGAEAGA